MADLFKFNANHDARGRFSSGDGGGDEVGRARGMINGAMAAMRAHAEALAGKVKHVITSTRFAGASPLPSGGVEIRGEHDLPSGRGTIATYVQLHPHMFTSSPQTQRALAAVNNGLVRSGVPQGVNKSPIVGATFKPVRHIGRRN